MDFTLDVVNPEEVKEKVEQELAVPATIDPAIQKAAEEKALQIMAVDLDSYDNRKEFTVSSTRSESTLSATRPQTHRSPIS